MVKIKKQKVRFRKRKNEPIARHPDHRLKSFAKFFVTALLVGVIGIGFVVLKYMFLETGYFVIKGAEVRLYDDSGALPGFSLTDIGGEKIVGTNIFFLDLKKLKKEIERSHTEFKDVVVRRILPNKLIVEAELRKPIAQIRSDRYYFVDKEGVLLPDVKNFPDPELPIIVGIGINLAKVKPYNFSRLEKDRIDKALVIIRGMQGIDLLRKLELKSVDIADPGNLSFFLEQSNVEIKIGKSDFTKRLELLAALLEQVGSDINNFKYIDLRFEDPILGPR